MGLFCGVRFEEIVDVNPLFVVITEHIPKSIATFLNPIQVLSFQRQYSQIREKLVIPPHFKI